MAELQVDGDNIVFSVPGSVAPWKQEAALQEVTQQEVETVKIDTKEQEVSIHVAVEMPFDIR